MISRACISRFNRDPNAKASAFECRRYAEAVNAELRKLVDPRLRWEMKVFIEKERCTMVIRVGGYIEMAPDGYHRRERRGFDVKLEQPRLSACFIPEKAKRDVAAFAGYIRGRA